MKSSPEGLSRIRERAAENPGGLERLTLEVIEPVEQKEQRMQWGGQNPGDLPDHPAGYTTR